MLAYCLSPALTHSASSSDSLESTSCTSLAAHQQHRYRIQRACSQRERELAFHILRSPFTIASSTPMADQHQTHSATFPYMLDGTGIHIDISGSPHGHRSQDQGHDQGHVQSPAQMSPPNAAGATQSAFMYHPFMDNSQQSYANAMHQASPIVHMNQGQPLTLDPAQLRTPSVGPSRVLTRRQARMQAAHPYANAAQENQQQQQQLNEGFGLFGTDTNSPRQQTPAGFHASAQLAAGRIGIPDLNIGQITIPDASTMSPQHPDTPASVTSSTFSHYGFAQYTDNGHSRSASSSTHPRSTSPAASVMSAATSLSSGSKTTSGRSRPPASSGSADCISAASFAPVPSDTTTVKPKRRLQNRQRKEICQYFIENPNSRQEDIAARWGVERSTVSKILKNKHRWLAVSESDDTVQAKHRPPKFATIELHMQSWLVECRESKTVISDAMIRAKARELARELNIPEDKFKASAGWVENYKHRANIKKGIWVGNPSPGVYTDEETEDDGPFLHDLIEERRRKLALDQVDTKRAAQDAEDGADISSIDLESSSVTLNPTGEWSSSMELSFGESSPTGLQSRMGVANEVNGQLDVNQNASPPQFSTANGFLQQQIETTQVSWTANDGPVATNGGGGQSSVSAQEAYSAMDVVVRFVQSQKPTFLNEKERNILTDIKHLIWVSAAQSTSASAARNAAPAAIANPVTTAINGPIGNANAVGTALASSNLALGAEPIAA
ncbi:hypothetical protein ACEPAF_9836 [Sanghuangporus sanghuang]